MLRIIVALVVLAVSGAACEAGECAKLRQCCEAIETEPWVGDSCGALVDNISRGETCAAVLDAIDVAATQRKAELPAVCQ